MVSNVNLYMYILDRLIFMIFLTKFCSDGYYVCEKKKEIELDNHK